MLGPFKAHQFVHFPIVLGPLEIIDKISPATLGPLVIIGQIFHQQRWAHLSPSVIFLVKNAGPIQSHRCVHFPIVLGPLEIIDKILPASLGPLVIIGQIFHRQHWAHLSPSVVSLAKNAGPIQSHRYVHFPIVLGPLDIIDKIFHQRHWAHLRPSIVSLLLNAGPIQSHRWGHLLNCIGPIRDHRYYSFDKMMGPCDCFGNFITNGPMRDICAHILMGPRGLSRANACICRRAFTSTSSNCCVIMCRSMRS